MTARLQDAEALLALVEAALKQVTDGPDDRRVAGVRNVLVFGHVLTASMKALAAKEPLFASWLEVQQPTDGVDELRRVMTAPPKVRRDYTQVQLASAGKEFGPRPANARTFFSGDRLGGVGWEIEIPGGRVEKFYVRLPDELPAGYAFENVKTLAKRHVAQLREMVKHARIASV